ncbi:ABC transporter substrate-binding protein [Rhodococcus sp. X156]|uniref:ABC transporter substrate-binding protein n=1 Tax=Rhodococcus sp. X156 TaxID=2499145 RepID=UPI000FDA7809|nr:ABC transporter substrate-binding protein [Rhodococcus sp. X156]
MTIRKRRGLALAGLLSATALVLSACGGGGSGEGGDASDVGVTADKVVIGGHYPLTGVAAPGYSEIPVGAKAYYDFVNKAGGVNGRQIEFKYLDDGYNPAKTSEVVNQLVLKDQVFAIVGGLGTPTHSAVVDFLNSEKVPDLLVSSGSLMWDQPKEDPMTFGWQTDYESEGKVLGQYIQKNMPGAKVGLFLQDDDLGADGAKGVKQFVGNQVVAEVKYVPGNTDVGPQLANLQKAGADVVVGFNVPSYTAVSQLTAMKLNYKPKWLYSNVGSDPKLVGSLLNRFSEGKVTGPSPLAGVFTTEYIPGVDSADDPWVQLWQKVWKEHGDGTELTNYKIYGMSEAFTFVQALQAAGASPTREGIVKAIETQGKDFQGPNLVPYRYSSDRHAGIGGMRVVQLDAKADGVPVTPLLQTDVGDAPITEYTGKPATPPASGIPDVKPAG